MARTKKGEEVVEKELLEEVAGVEDIDLAEEVPAEVTYALNGYNFTAVGEHFLTLCHNTVKIKTDNIPLYKAAEEQVKLGVLKVVK